MINIEKSYAGDIPFLHIAEASAEVPRPTVIFFHGFGSAKEHNLHYAYLMAEKGLRVLLPDALYHGERAGEHTEQELMGLFWPTVTRSIEEAANRISRRRGLPIPIDGEWRALQWAAS